MPKDRLSFPFPEDCEVRISDDKYSMNIVSGGVIVSSQGSSDDDIPVDPACIVIDEKHIYLRRNWESWHTINTANKVFVKKLMESATCLIYDSVGGMTEEYRIPIYKLSNFPERLFKEDQLGEMLSSMSKRKNNDKTGLKKSDYDSRLDEFLPSEIFEWAKKWEVDIFPHVLKDKHMVDVAFSTANVAVLCNAFKSKNSVVAKKKEEDLYYIRNDMLSEEPDAECHIVLVTDIIDGFMPQRETTKVLVKDELFEFLKEIYGDEKNQTKL
jgi:hypothetical protein